MANFHDTPYTPSPPQRTPGTGERRLAALLARADIALNGSRPFDLQLHRPGAAARILAQGSLGSARLTWMATGTANSSTA